MKQNFSKVCLAALLLLTAISCKKDPVQGPMGYKSLIDISELAAGSTCPSGGVVVKSGIDKNNNNILDPDEVDQTKSICSGGSDKQIMIPIPDAAGNTTKATGIITGSLLKFNKKNFQNVDSIILVHRMYIAPNGGNSAMAQLYNKTDNLPIANSQLTSSSTYENSTYIQTGNLYSVLPDREIELGVKLWTSEEGKFAGFFQAFLFLYRK